MFTANVKNQLVTALHYCANRRKVTPIELRILQMIAIDGYSLTSVANVSHRSIKTLSTHKRSAYAKLGVTSDVEFIHYIYNIKNELFSVSLH